MLRLIRWTAASLIVLIGLAWGLDWLATGDRTGFARATAVLTGATAPPVTGAFSLVGADGQPVTDAMFRGRWMLVYFGYTYCADTCPTQLQTISSALDLLGAKASRIAPLFITIDPARDTPAMVGQYTGLFDPRLIGLTGSAAQVKAAEAAYNVSYRKILSVSKDSIMIDHMGQVFFLDVDGKLNTLFQPGMDAEAMAKSIGKSMSNEGEGVK